MTSLALTAGRKQARESWEVGDFGRFLHTMARIRGVPFEDIIRADLKPDPAFDPSVSAMSARFRVRFARNVSSDAGALHAIYDVLSAEFSYGIFADLLGPLFSVQADAKSNPGPKTHEAASYAADIRKHWDALSTARPGSKRAEVWECLFDWDVACQEAGPDAHIRKDFIIHGDYPYQWVERLDPNRPLDPARPWLRPRLSSAYPRILPFSERPKAEPLPPPRPWDPAVDGEPPF